MGERRSLRPETVAITAGRSEAPGAPLSVPPTFASVFRDGGAIGYGRWDNPTWSAFEAALGALEHGGAVAFGSGQAAVAAVLDDLPNGSVVGYPSVSYSGTRDLLRDLGERGRIVPRAVDATDTAAVLDALPGLDLLWLESPSNPLLGITDLPRVLPAARDAGVRTVVDNTFATPLGQQPLRLGADVVVHSATKYLGGHSDLLLGVAVTADDERRAALVAHRTRHGSIPGTMEAFLALRGLRTLPVRWERQQATAGLLAERLAGHLAVTRVRYPGLPGHEQHQRARDQLAGFGAMLAIELPDVERADAMVAALRLVVGGTSLGGVETTIDRRSRWSGEEAIPRGLLRISVGVEHPEDLWEDLAAGLEAASQRLTG